MAELDPLVCYIKSDYKIDLPEKPVKEEEVAVTEKEGVVEQEAVTNNDEPPSKKHKKHKDRGMNKARPVFREAWEDKLCRSLIDGVTDEPCKKENCKFLHDVPAFMESKAADIAETCPIYSTKGFCNFGVTCRFASDHLTEDFKNINKNNVEKTNLRNHLPFELQAQLRKKTYSFKKADAIVNEMVNLQKLNAKEKPIGFVPDTDLITTRLAEKKKVDFNEKLLLSPLTTVGNLPFRRICKEYGADITCGEMACSVPIIQGALQEWALTKRHSSEDVFGVQICGHNSTLCSYAAEVLSDNIDVDFIDLNIGCPIDLIFQQGGGSALIRRPNVLELIVRSCSKLLAEKPFTVKTRTGVYSNKSVAHELIPKIEEWGASAVTIHGRSKEQRYTKSADWEYIERCAASVKSIPVIGNGDIMGVEDYKLAREVAPHLSGVMIGRGGLIKPWIFKEIKDGHPYDISSKERFDMLQKYCNYGLEHWGSDTKGVETTRRFFLEWNSFLYRYVPYGILERPPQKINQRPENDRYSGRDDMETLMASGKSSDWVKISEIFLGKVPEGFVFLPKHKANSY